MNRRKEMEIKQLRNIRHKHSNKETRSPLNFLHRCSKNLTSFSFVCRQAFVSKPLLARLGSAQLGGYVYATFRRRRATYLGHHVVAHGVLLRGGQQGGLRGSLGLRRLRWAGQKATAGLGGHWRRANIGADEGQAW